MLWTLPEGFFCFFEQLKTLCGWLHNKHNVINPLCNSREKDSQLNVSLVKPTETSRPTGLTATFSHEPNHRSNTVNAATWIYCISRLILKLADSPTTTLYVHTNVCILNVYRYQQTGFCLIFTSWFTFFCIRGRLMPEWSPAVCTTKYTIYTKPGLTPACNYLWRHKYLNVPKASV